MNGDLLCCRKDVMHGDIIKQHHERLPILQFPLHHQLNTLGHLNSQNIYTNYLGFRHSFTTQRTFPVFQSTTIKTLLQTLVTLRIKLSASESFKGVFQKTRLATCSSYFPGSEKVWTNLQNIGPWQHIWVILSPLSLRPPINYENNKSHSTA